MDLVLGMVQILTLIALIVYVWKTWEMASASRQSSQIAERTLLELRDSRDQETAPYVVVDFDLLTSKGLIYLVVKNIGKSVARNVTLAFSPQLQTSDGDKPYGISEVGFIKDGIPSLPPGHEVRTILDGMVSYFGAAGLPPSYTVRVSYCGGLSAAERTESFMLDLSMHKNSSYVQEAGIKELIGAIKELSSRQAKTEQAVTRVANRLEGGLWLHPFDLTVIPPNILHDEWKVAVASRLRGFGLLWASLVRRNEDRRITEMPPSEIQVRARLASEQVLLLAAKCPEPDSVQVVRELTNIAAQLREIARMRMWADGGQSLDSLQKLGDEVVRHIDEVVALLTSEAAAPSFPEAAGHAQAEVEATMSLPAERDSANRT